MGFCSCGKACVCNVVEQAGSHTNQFPSSWMASKAAPASLTPPEGKFADFERVVLLPSAATHWSQQALPPSEEQDEVASRLELSSFRPRPLPSIPLPYSQSCPEDGAF